MLDGVTAAETKELTARFATEADPVVRLELLSAGASAERTAELHELVTKGLLPAQPESVRLQALHLAKDNFPELVEAAVHDGNETIRVYAEALLDPGRSGSKIRE